MESNGGRRGPARRWASRPWLCTLLGACVGGSGEVGSTGDVEWTLEPEPSISLGMIEGDLRYTFSRIRALRLLPEGGVLVADRDGQSIRLFDEEANFVRGWGRQGDGPGEFRYIWSVWVPGPDSVFVYDSSHYRLSVFGRDGLLHRTVSMRGDDGAPEIHAGTMNDGRHVIGWIRRPPTTRGAIIVDRMRVGVFDIRGELQDIVASGNGMRRLTGPLPFTPFFHVALVGDSVVVTDGLDGTLDLIGPDGLKLRTLDVGLEPVEADAAWAALLDRIEDEATVGELRLIREEPTADSVPVLSDLLVDDEARIWVKRYNPSTDSNRVRRRRTGGEWLVLRTDGSRVARVRMPDDFRPMDVRRGHVGGITVDDLDVQRVRVYEIRER